MRRHMPEQIVSAPHKAWLPGIDPAATPLVGLGLGLTGVLLRLQPKLAAWPLALTAFAMLLYRDPKRSTPNEETAIFAPADGVVIDSEEIYEHRFLHTDAISLSIAATPFDVPVHRSPASGTIAYLEHLPAEDRSTWYARSSEDCERLYIGIKTDKGPLLVE